MATLIVEDGSVVSNANTYANLDTVDSYHDDLGNAAWALGTVDNRTDAILRGMRYLKVLHWKGTTLSGVEGQPLSWPREDVYDADSIEIDSDIVPTRVVSALCEAALNELNGTDMLKGLDRGGAIKKKRVDVISLEYQPSADRGMTFTAIERLLRGLVYSDYIGEVERA